MLSTYIIKIKTESGEREVLISPLLLQSKTRPDLKSGTINKLYFYDQLRDDDYKANLKQEFLSEQFQSDKYIINYGQDFEKHYLGSYCIDFESKSYWQWEGKPGGLTEQEVKILDESLFNPQAERRDVVLFTPTRPSDFNLGKI